MSVSAVTACAGKAKVKFNVKGDGQECPSHISGSYSRFPSASLRAGSHRATARFGMTKVPSPTHGLFCGEDDFGVEESAGDAGGDGEQFRLAGEDFDLAGAGYVGEVDGASAADAGGGGLVGGDGGELGQELAGVDEERAYSWREFRNC